MFASVSFPLPVRDLRADCRPVWMDSNMGIELRGGGGDSGETFDFRRLSRGGGGVHHEPQRARTGSSEKSAKPCRGRARPVEKACRDPFPTFHGRRLAMFRMFQIPS